MEKKKTSCQILTLIKKTTFFKTDKFYIKNFKKDKTMAAVLFFNPQGCLVSSFSCTSFVNIKLNNKL